MWLLPLLFACGSEPEAIAPPTVHSGPEAHWVKRSDAELKTVLQTACEASLADSKPVLLEFSAPWCIDCRALELLEPDPGMVEEYANWHRVRVDVGRFDRHRDLQEAFEVKAIAHWNALKPDDCKQTADRWPRLGSRLVELDSGAAKEGGTEALLMWLRMARSRG